MRLFAFIIFWRKYQLVDVHHFLFHASVYFIFYLFCFRSLVLIYYYCLFSYLFNIFFLFLLINKRSASLSNNLIICFRITTFINCIKNQSLFSFTTLRQKRLSFFELHQLNLFFMIRDCNRRWWYWLLKSRFIIFFFYLW